MEPFEEHGVGCVEFAAAIPLIPVDLILLEAYVFIK